MDRRTGPRPWTVLELRSDANTAAQHDTTWTTYLRALGALLECHPKWRVTCESDCDQYSLQALQLTVETLLEKLDEYRKTDHYPIAFCAESGVDQDRRA